MAAREGEQPGGNIRCETFIRICIGWHWYFPLPAFILHVTALCICILMGKDVFHSILCSAYFHTIFDKGLVMGSQGGLTAEVGSRCTLSHSPLYTLLSSASHSCVDLGTFAHICHFRYAYALFCVLKRMCKMLSQNTPKITQKGGTIGTLTAGTKRRCARWFNAVSTCTYCAP